MQKTCDKLGVNYIFKASYDKANRSSGQSFRGPGIKDGLHVLAKIRAEFELPILTDVHTEEQVRLAAEVADVLQIPAFLCRQTDLINAAVRTGKIVNIKKGQFLSPQEMGGNRRWRKKTFTDRTRNNFRLQQSRCRYALDSDHARLWFSGGVRCDAFRAIAWRKWRSFRRTTRIRAHPRSRRHCRWRKWPLHRDTSESRQELERRSKHDSSGRYAGNYFQPSKSSRSREGNLIWNAYPSQ